MQNIFYPKKCVNYDKSNLRQNSLKGPKDPNSAQKKHNAPKCARKCYQKARNYFLSRQNRVNFCKYFNWNRIFLCQHCWHVCMFYISADYLNHKKMTFDTWHMTRYMCYVVGGTFSQNIIFGGKVIWRSGGKDWLCWMNDSIIDKSGCRITPATSGLLKM